MLLRAVVLAVLVAAAGARCEDPPARRHDGGRPEVDVLVPVEPREHERIWWMHRHDRRLAPPTVSIDGEPYVCDVDGRRFAAREAFVAHLRGDHLVDPERVPDLLYEVEGEVHFTGE
jgi:hypothetical protein